MRILTAILVASLSATSAFAASINISPMPVDLAFPTQTEKSITEKRDNSVKAYVAPGKSVKSQVKSKTRKMPRYTSK
ncbi:hypothetical protein [Ahrensia sp. R2A130]|uniref:hypothetical protein n=1 Tax=Ahrensia sp. R2A130 TaxID=744979 RepID=UPI0001E0C31F|nr:hypothetical protein [Ahrensia sp. R2A130]EFL90791.1 ribosomal protein L25/L23 [Ahrensia sp. R2A130]